jgi:hypothetical protein
MSFQVQTSNGYGGNTSKMVTDSSLGQTKSANSGNKNPMKKSGEEQPYQKGLHALELKEAVTSALSVLDDKDMIDQLAKHFTSQVDLHLCIWVV